MKSRCLLALLLAPLLVASVSCSQPVYRPFDIKGQWQAVKGECGNYCKFVIMDDIDRDHPEKLFIVFPANDDKSTATGYVFTHVAGEEWLIEFHGNGGNLYLKGQQLVSLADITYEKVADLPSKESKK